MGPLKIKTGFPTNSICQEPLTTQGQSITKYELQSLIGQLNANRAFAFHYPWSEGANHSGGTRKFFVGGVEGAKCISEGAIFFFKCQKWLILTFFPSGGEGRGWGQVGAEPLIGGNAPSCPSLVPPLVNHNIEELLIFDLQKSLSSVSARCGTVQNCHWQKA